MSVPAATDNNNSNGKGQMQFGILYLSHLIDVYIFMQFSYNVSGGNAEVQHYKILYFVGEAFMGEKLMDKL